MFKKIQESEQKLATQISTGSLDKESVQILESVSGKNKKDLTGKITHKLLMKLKQKSKEVNKDEDELEKIFDKMTTKMINENIKLKEDIFKHFLEGSKPQNIPLAQ